MKLKIDGATLYLGRLTKSGSRNVERVRLTNLRTLLPALRKARVPAKMVGHRLTVRVDDQLKLAFMDAG